MIVFTFENTVFLKKFSKDLKKLSAFESQYVKQFLQKILSGAKTPHIKKLKNYPHAEYRIRHGKFRLLFDVDEQRQKNIFIACKHRKDLY